MLHGCGARAKREQQGMGVQAKCTRNKYNVREMQIFSQPLVKIDMLYKNVQWMDHLVDRSFIPPPNSSKMRACSKTDNSSSTGYHSHLVEHTADIGPTTGFATVGVVVVHVRSSGAHVRWPR